MAYNPAALGLLGARLMAGGAPSTDPGASQRAWGQAAADYQNALLAAEEREEKKKLRDLQMKEAERESAEKDREARARDALKMTLLGRRADAGTAWGAGDLGSFAVPEEGATELGGMASKPGILAKQPEDRRALLEGMAQYNPELAMKEVLKKPEGYTLSPGAARYDAAGNLVAERSAEAKPPQSRSRTEGDVTIFEEYDPRKMKWAEVSRGPRYKPETNVTIKDASEVQGTIDAISKARAEGNDRLADKLEMGLTFGNKPPPEAYIKARQNIEGARAGISKAYELIAEGTGPVLPKDRAKLAQAFNEAKLAYADLSNRGANFTEQEVAMVDSVLGGDPNEIASRVLRGDQSYLDGLRQAAEVIERRGGGLMDAYTKPGVGKSAYPWESKVPVVSPDRRKELEEKYGAR